MNVRLRGRHRKLLAAGIVAAATLLTTGCAGSDGDSGSSAESGAADNSEPIQLYASLGLSGANQANSAAFGAGLQAAVDTINENGGLLGRDVELATENNESDPTKAVSLLQEQLGEDAPDWVWAGSSSSDALAMLGVLTREKIMAFSPGSAPQVGDPSQFPYSFSAGVTSASIADALTQQLTDEGYKTVGILTANNAFGGAAAQSYAAAFEDAGLKVVAETYEPDAVEMKGPLGRIQEGNPDVVVFNDFIHPTYVLKSRTELGMGDVPFLGDLSASLSDLTATLTDEDMDGVTVATYEVQTTAADGQGVKNLLDSLAANDVKVSGGLQLYSMPYDSVLAWANAVEAVGSLDADKVKAALEGNEGDTYTLAASDDYGWTDKVHQAGGIPFVMIPVSPMNADGQFETTP
jgi:ABC-type branched-subunit amino acid transport system substrate-binding protein